jgi:hypothetical protein
MEVEAHAMNAKIKMKSIKYKIYRSGHQLPNQQEKCSLALILLCLQTYLHFETSATPTLLPSTVAWLPDVSTTSCSLVSSLK